MENNSIKITGRYSLFAQVFTGIVDILALRTETKTIILKQLLTLELIVQIIEFTFYTWLVYYSPSNSEEITKYRYYDWALSTNVMLFTLISYIVHLHNPKKNIIEIYKENKRTIHLVLALNSLMLYIGYLGEIKKIDVKQSVYIGFIPFLIYYSIIYQNYVKDDVLIKSNIPEEKRKEIKLLFWYFFLVWSMYGVSALFPYEQKNIS